MGHHRSFRRLAAGAFAAATALSISAVPGADVVEAGQPVMRVNLMVVGIGADQVIEDLTVELWESPTGSIAATCTNVIDTSAIGPALLVNDQSNCPEASSLTGEHQLGVSGAPANATVTAFCFQPDLGERIEDESAIITFPYVGTCYIDVRIPGVVIDKQVSGGEASTDDFTLEVYDADGELVDSGSDPGSDPCALDYLFLTGTPEAYRPNVLTVPPVKLTGDCLTMGLPDGEYQIGEAMTTGYLPSNVACIPFFSGFDNEAFPDGIGEFAVTGDRDSLDQALVAYCEVTNTYREGSLTVEKVVVNDDGSGTAGPDDFTAEVYLDGALATSADCDTDGTCIDTDLAIGEYRIGESGPTGYTASVACTTDTPADTVTIDTVAPTTSTPQLREAISGDAALVDLGPGAEVTCVITNDDVATTTTIDPNVGILPPTGSGNRAATVIALGLLAFGGTLVALRRRTV